MLKDVHFHAIGVTATALVSKIVIGDRPEYVCVNSVVLHELFEVN